MAFSNVLKKKTKKKRWTRYFVYKWKEKEEFILINYWKLRKVVNICVHTQKRGYTYTQKKSSHTDTRSGVTYIHIHIVYFFSFVC